MFFKNNIWTKLFKLAEKKKLLIFLIYNKNIFNKKLKKNCKKSLL